ncbi:MAG: SUMF1/EgtB/PvdO family nonheme iron enzyme, partial [Acidobacteria bacterium]|nr:SUMF1/EgtB/PvdO family nonheme iron enzyme [Acidobacteriota bacterium]
MTNIRQKRRCSFTAAFVARTLPLAATAIAGPAVGPALALGARIRADPPALDFAFIPAADDQPGGPTYDFRISRFEVRNDQFAVFLNDAIAKLDNERGQFMYFDIDTGDVYIHTAVRGFIGTNGSGTLLFKASANAYLSYNETSGNYEVTQGGESHPVTGVTWYGAVKFCNWLTIDTGLGVGERAYTEAPAGNLIGWHPVTITTQAWATRDLNDDERDELLTGLGYRLPMDGGVDGPAPYNEWVKAASSRTEGQDTVFDAAFGFGRSNISSADANHLDSGDPFEPGTTPVGFYDGTDHGGTFSTNPNDNAYGLFDMSGNVWEWLQDQAPSDPSGRRNRGGSWQSLGTDLRVTLGVDRTSISAEDSTGFRIVQRVLTDLLVTPPDGLAAEGPWGGPYDTPFSDRITYRISNVVLGAVSFTVATDAAWVTVVPVTGSVNPGESVDFTLTLQPDCTDGLTVGENVSTVTIRNGDGQIIAERVVHLTVREPLSLTPAAGFAARMPFGTAPAPPNTFYIFDSVSELPVSWSTELEDTAVDTWLTLPTSGEVLPGGVAGIIVVIDTEVVRTFPPGTYTMDITFSDDCTGETFVRTATLDVLTPFSVSPEDEVVSTGVFGGPFDPLSHSFTVANLLDDPVSWSVAICSEAPGSVQCTPPAQPAWLELDLTGGTLPAGDTSSVTAAITPAADALETGVYSLTLRFEQPATGFLIDRVVTLEITGLLVEPEHDVEFRGPFGGPFEPPSFMYSLRNTGLVEMSWTASLEFDPPLDQIGNLSWLEVTPTAGVIVDDTGMDEVTVSLTIPASSLVPGMYEATIEFSANGAAARRKVTLAVGGEAFSVPMVIVPGDDAQPSGPVYDYRIARFEITSAEFVHFLNDARRNALSDVPDVPDTRSHYMYFDIDSGDVYINDQQAGEEGTEA